MFLIPFVAAFIGLLTFFIYLNYSLTFKRALLVRKMREYRLEWDRELLNNFGYYELLSLELRSKLLNKISIFYNEKNWDTNIKEEEKLLACARACLPIVNRKSNFYPQVEDNLLSINQEDWFSKNALQFEKEIGKMRFREFDGRFVEYSMEYFKNPKAMKSKNKRFFDLLNHYYKLSS